ncbi:MAG: integration host factor subunit beta [Myxococcales bacterium]|nr:MAG: integration host factor subunit beta [Myxococcales bacterium]
MTKRDLIDEIVRMYPSYSGRDAEVIVNAVFEAMTEALTAGERIEIRGFGSFVVKQRRAREGRNPKTGEIVAVAAKRVPFFKVGKELKLRVDKDEEVAVEAASSKAPLPSSTPPVPTSASTGSRSV